MEGMETWQEKVEERIKKRREILFSPTDILFSELEEKLSRANRRAIILWAFELSEEVNKRITLKYPDEERGTKCLETSALWASGFIKMKEAKEAIIKCHAAAKETENKEDIALFHAIAQGCSSVHTPKHAMGLPVYELTAIVRRKGFVEEEILTRVKEYLRLLEKAIVEEQSYKGSWAGFLLF